jgi:hypothetical protein
MKGFHHRPTVVHAVHCEVLPTVRMLECLLYKPEVVRIIAIFVEVEPDA